MGNLFRPKYHGVRLGALGILLAFAPSAGAGIIADLSTDYATGGFPSGWQFLRNTAAIGDSANYTHLLWDAGNSRYDITGNSITDSNGAYTSLMNGGQIHPGQGIGQGAAFDGYTIAAYTIQSGEAGLVSIDGSLTGIDPDGATGSGANGWDLRIFVGNSQAGGTLYFPWSMQPEAFSRALGSLNAGDTVYVAVGPGSRDYYDSSLLAFQLESTPQVPEPGMLSLVGLGLAALWGHRRFRARDRQR